MQNNNSDSLIAKVMKIFSYKHQYQVAEYFGVTAQTLSGWVKTGIVPDKYVMKFQLDIQELEKKDNYIEQPKKINQVENHNPSFPKEEINKNEFSFTIFFANYVRPLIIIPFTLSILSLFTVLFIIIKQLGRC